MSLVADKKHNQRSQGADLVDTDRQEFTGDPQGRDETCRAHLLIYSSNNSTLRHRVLSKVLTDPG